MRKPILAPSILSADFSALGEATGIIEASGADWIHVDIMDGRFVPVITFGHKLVADLRKKTALPLDVHLMIQHPENQIDNFCSAGADYLTIHYEGNIHHNKLFQQIRAGGSRCGISIVPSTPVESLIEILPYVDLVLVMSVNPGYGGQLFLESSLPKLAKLVQFRDQYNLDYKISIDGGVNKKNAGQIFTSGADILVTGSAFFEEADPGSFIENLRDFCMKGSN